PDPKEVAGKAVPGRSIDNLVAPGVVSHRTYILTGRTAARRVAPPRDPVPFPDQVGFARTVAEQNGHAASRIVGHRVAEASPGAIGRATLPSQSVPFPGIA